MPPTECIYQVSNWYLKACWRKVRKTRTDGRTDGHCHGIIRPFFKRAYKNRAMHLHDKFSSKYNQSAPPTPAHAIWRKRNENTDNVYLHVASVTFHAKKMTCTIILHDDVIKWKYLPRYWPFVRGIHRSPVNSPHKGHWRGVLMLSSVCARINAWVNNREAGDLRRHRAHYDVIVMGHNQTNNSLVPAIGVRELDYHWFRHWIGVGAEPLPELILKCVSRRPVFGYKNT